jgi:hypothetical protein
MENSKRPENDSAWQDYLRNSDLRESQENFGSKSLERMAEREKIKTEALLQRETIRTEKALEREKIKTEEQRKRKEQRTAGSSTGRSPKVDWDSSFGFGMPFFGEGYFRD